MSKRTCLYCDAHLPDPRQRVCVDHRAHHRSVLHYRRRGEERPTANCVTCGVLLPNVKARFCPACRKLENARIERERKRERVGPKPTRSCKACGEPIGPERRRDAEHRSRSCIEKERAASGIRIQYIRENQQRRSAKYREWRRKNPARASNHRLSRRNREATGALTERDWSRVLARSLGRCFYCGDESKLTMDHVVPLCRGGTHTIGNVVPACGPCNFRKGRRFITEWRIREKRINVA